MINKKKFLNKNFTLDGKIRAFVKLRNLENLWFNTGTLCNLKCNDCYIESSPFNKSLQHISLKDVKKYIEEIKEFKLGTNMIGLTGGEPFMNSSIIDILKYLLFEKFKVLVLSNGMRPIQLKFNQLLLLPKLKNLTIRISIDHYKKEYHEKIRGKNTWDQLIKNIIWLNNKNINLNLASKLNNNEKEYEVRKKFDHLFKKIGLRLNAFDKSKLTLFPIMNSEESATEITQECWNILNKNPDSIMCSNSRMIVKRNNEKDTKVLACTLITKDKDFELGKSIISSKKKVFLNHPFCSQFCVLGNSSCS
jgi:sulfatase maturation enzyme AslB (radical SAM superfamily)